MATINDALAIAWKLFQAGDRAGALRVYQEVARIDPSVVAAWQMIGAIYQVGGRGDAALSSYERVLELDPNHVEALNNMAVALHSLGRFDEALGQLQQALSLKPDYADAHSNLGNALKEEGRFDEAIASYHRALGLNPSHFDAIFNLGYALRAQGKLTESVAAYERALAVKPNSAQVRTSRALCWLQMGDFRRGWLEYEWRLQCQEFAIPAFGRPLWDGSPLERRSVLLYADHGFGDSIQFIRYAPLVQARARRVIVACRQPLARLFARYAGVDQVIEEGCTLPEFDVFAPLMSLPRIFETTLADIPANFPYLDVEPTIVEHWRRAIQPRGRLNVGISWQGNPDYRQDRHRSFRLTQLETLARIEGVRLFSLQKGLGAEQIGELGGRFVVTDLASRFTDFMDSAAVIRNLDLVISADSAIAHLAGALAVPIWAAIPFAADWRWMNDREDSPWYPTMRLFRQRTWGGWDEVFTRMAGELPAMIQDP